MIRTEDSRIHSTQTEWDTQGAGSRVCVRTGLPGDGSCPACEPLPWRQPFPQVSQVWEAEWLALLLPPRNKVVPHLIKWPVGVKYTSAPELRAWLCHLLGPTESSRQCQQRPDMGFFPWARFPPFLAVTIRTYPAQPRPSRLGSRTSYVERV